MISSPRRICYEALLKIELQDVFSDHALNSPEVSALDARDRNLVTEILYGTLRWQGWLDYLLDRHSSRAWSTLVPEARILLRMSLYQLVFLNRIPTYAIVNDAVNLIKRRRRSGLDKYINGILRNLARTRPWKEESYYWSCPEWVRVSLPQWIWERWKTRFGEKTAESFALSLNTPPIHFFRPADESAKGLKRDSLEGAYPSDLVPGCYASPQGLPHSTGADIIHEQDEASQLIPHLLGDIAGKCVWDACAAPGGKSRILRQLVGPGGHVIASDLREKRIKRMRDLHSADAGLGNFGVLVADASQYPPYLSQFDAVLADVPCTGLGTLRRNPEIKWRMRENRLAEFQKIQRDIVEKVADAVKIGGLLLYSTCSTEPEENEDVVHSFLNNTPGFVLRKPEALPGTDPWIGEDHMFRSYPGDRSWDGFFAALMVRKY